MKRLLILGALVVLGYVILNLIAINLSFISTPRSIAIDNISMQPNKIRIKGYLIDSSVAFHHHTYEYKNGVLTVYIHVKNLIKIKPGSGDFCLIIPRDYSDVKEVHLGGTSAEDKKKIWP